MPRPSNPRRHEYFVYSMAVEGKSFYVGIGRSARATDRVRYVKYLVKRQRTGHPVNWVLSNEVIAKLLAKNLSVKPKLLRIGLNRNQALVRERRAIQCFQSRGVILANRQHNGGASLSARDVLSDISRRLKLESKRKRQTA